ncbi:MAG TPA: hypothetical protein VGF75_03555 [Candidatus Saccharimonadales bacterium]|jgi:hypothetical protein
MARVRPGKRQREMLKVAFDLLAQGRAEVKTKVAGNLSQLHTFERSVVRDSTIMVEQRVKRDGFNRARYVGALGEGPPKPKHYPKRWH